MVFYDYDYGMNHHNIMNIILCIFFCWNILIFYLIQCQNKIDSVFVLEFEFVYVFRILCHARPNYARTAEQKITVMEHKRL